MLNVGIFLIWALACVFLQVDHVDGAEACAIPFIFEGQQYFDCTNRNSIYYWCSLDEEFSGRWKYCTKDDYAQCAFPFTFKGKMYDSCTTDGSPIKREWCSVTENYDRDKSWKNCF